MCNTHPEIELKNNGEVKISCSNCKIVSNEKIESIVNYSSKWVTNAIVYCSSSHEKKIAAVAFSKKNNLFLCNECLKFYQDDHYLSQKMKKTIDMIYKIEKPEGKDIININFINEGENILLKISCKTTLNEALKKFLKIINLPDNFIDKLIFIKNGINLDNKSTMTLEEIKIIDNQKLLVNINIPDNNEIIKLNNLKKNYCAIHNKIIKLKCIKCKLNICDQCMEIHKGHSNENLETENSFYKEDLKEYENYIMNNENKKRELCKKVEENIIWFDNYRKEVTDIKDELNSVIEKILKKFYYELEKGQNLAFLSEILINTYIKIDKNDSKIKEYKNVINQINQFFNEEKIKEFDLNNFPVQNDYKDKCKCVYKSNYNFIPQIKLKFNDVEKIDKEIIDSFINKCKEIFKDKNVNIIDIRKGSLSIVIALNYLAKEKLKTMDIENKNKFQILEELNAYFNLETNNIKNILENNLTIAQKDKEFKPDFVEENLFDLKSSPNELVKSICLNKEKNCEGNIFEISQSIKMEDIKSFFDSLEEETRETQDNLYNRILDINNELEQYLQIFDKQFEENLKKSIFEYSIKYIAYIYRHDENYISGQTHCNNIKTKILFHGTNSTSISLILSDEFNKARIAWYGPGVYFSDLLDYTWFYADDSGKKGCKNNVGSIPKINDTFSFIVSNIYYDENKFEQVYDRNDNEVQEYGIRHIKVNHNGHAIPKEILKSYTKFVGTEYLIPSMRQILPLLSVTVERVKYLIVWRDNNFNKSNPNNYTQFEQMLSYNNEIKNYASFNLKTRIYYFNESNEALEFIKWKKYNKIILITNGKNNGYEFIQNARKIIGNNTIAMITSFIAKNHLKEVQNMENVLFNSGYCDCMKEFLRIVCNENLSDMTSLQDKLEKKYQELDSSFHFKKISQNAFYFPKFKESGRFEELDFSNDNNETKKGNKSNCNII